MRYGLHAHSRLALQGSQRAPLLHLPFHQGGATRAAYVRIETSATPRHGHGVAGRPRPQFEVVGGLTTPLAGAEPRRQYIIKWYSPIRSHPGLTSSVPHDLAGLRRGIEERPESPPLHLDTA
jgi:hypothetical protein